MYNLKKSIDFKHLSFEIRFFDAKSYKTIYLLYT